MPSIMEMMRLRNIFGQPPVGNDLPSQGGIMGNMGIQTPSFADAFKPKPDPYGNISFGPPNQMAKPALALSAPEENDDVSSMMQRLYTPESEATNKFNELVGQYPMREKPGIWRSIAAGLTAFGPGGHNLAMQVAQQPFLNKQEDWKNKIGPAQAAAGLERQTNVNERQMAYQTVAATLRQKADEARATKDEARTKIMQDRAEVYRLKSLKGNFKFDFSGPKVLVADPTTGEIKQTDIDTGSLSDADKMALGQENVMEQIGMRGRQATALEEQRQGGREGLAETRGWQIFNVPDGQGGQKAVKINQITGEVKDLDINIGAVTRPSSAGSSARGELPTQTKVRQANAARQLLNTRPDLAPFIKMGTGNEFTIVPTGKSMFGNATGPTSEQQAAINAAIYGKGELPVSPVAVHGPVQKVIRQHSPSTGKIRESTDGGKTWRIVNQ